MRTLTVDLGDRSYPIYIGEGLLSKSGEYFLQHQLTTKSPVLIVSDENIAPEILADRRRFAASERIPNRKFGREGRREIKIAGRLRRGDDCGDRGRS